MPRWLTEDGVQLYYEVYGQGVPVLFIHPPLMDHTVFKYQKHLGDKMQVILVDAVGHGRSAIGQREHYIESLARDLADLLTYLSIEKAVIVGYSSGGSIAQQLTLDFPEKVSALVLSGGYPKVGTWLLEKEYQAGIALIKYHRKHFLSWVLAVSHKISKQDQRLFFESCMLADSQTVYKYYLESLYFDCTNRLHEINQPMLLIYGDRSDYFHPHIPLYKQSVANLQIVFVTDAFHQLPTKNHKEFNGIIEQFVHALYK